MVGHRLHGEVDHPVTAAHDQGVDPVGDALPGQVERLAGVAALEVADGEPGTPQAASARWRTLAPLPLPRRRVRQEGDLPARHARRLPSV